MKFLFAVLLAVSSYAASEIPDTDMHAVTREIVALQKFLFSSGEFGLPKNEAQINGSLDILEKHLRHLETGVFADQPALRANASLLSFQIQDARRAFREGSKPYARYMLQSSLGMCVACHTRTASPDFLLPEAELRGAGPPEKAEYYFATRQFEKGRAIYEEILAAGAPGLGPARARDAALSLAIYYARVKSDPKGGAGYFRSLAGNKRLSPDLRKECKAWSADFEKWAKEKEPSGAALSEQQLLERGRRLLKDVPPEGDGKLAVRRLRASALFHAVLETAGEKSPAKGEALLHLGRIYGQLHYQMYYRLGEMYLKGCISDYRKEKIAQECYGALERAVKQRVGAGSRTSPTAEEVELLQLKRLAF